jgi:hypothetical protein
MFISYKPIHSILLYTFLIVSVYVKAQNIDLISSSNSTFNKKTVGVLHVNKNSIQNGYTLLYPSNSTKTFLINNDGKIINQWTSNYNPGQTAYLMDNGNLVRSCKTNNIVFKLGGIGGRIEIKNWNDDLLWEWELSDSTKCLHHDIKPLPNGNILAIMIEKKLLQDVVSAGRDTLKLSDKELWNEVILEIKPVDNNKAEIIWQWSAWDHLVQNKYADKINYNTIEKHPELIDVNYNLELNSTADFLHFNSIDFNSQLNQIMVSVRNYSEIWIIDHSTTTAQAKTHKGGKTGMGGDLIYRWGNNKTFGVNTDAKLDGQHSASWIKRGNLNEGKITVFDNKATTRNARIVMLNPSLNKQTFKYNYIVKKGFGPDKEFWTYTQTNFVEGRAGAVQGLQNGNVLITETSKGRLLEITPQKDTAWIYIIPFNNDKALTQNKTFETAGSSFKSEKYSINYDAFLNKKIVEGSSIELNPKMSFSRLEITPAIDSIKPITLSKHNKCLMPIDNALIFYNKPISVYSQTGDLYDEQTINENGKFYLGLYNPGIYYVKCNNAISKIEITN